MNKIKIHFSNFISVKKYMASEIKNLSDVTKNVMKYIFNLKAKKYEYLNLQNETDKNEVKK